MSQNSSDALADLQQDSILLQERLADCQRENHLLHRQLYSAMALLDIAVSKLAQLGCSLETSIDLRALRAEAMRGREGSEPNGAPSFVPSELAGRPHMLGDADGNAGLMGSGGAGAQGSAGGVGGAGGGGAGSGAGVVGVAGSAAGGGVNRRGDAGVDGSTSGGGGVAGGRNRVTATISSSNRFTLFKTLAHHTKAVHCCAFAPGYTDMLVSGGLDCQLILHHYSKPETKIWAVAAHTECISDVGWMSSHTVLSGSYDGTVRVWDVNRDGIMVHAYQAARLILSAVPLDKGHLYACADSGSNVAIVDIRAHRPASVREMTSRVNSLAFDGSSNVLFTGQSDGCVSMWDIRKTSSVLQQQPPPPPPMPTIVEDFSSGVPISNTSMFGVTSTSGNVSVTNTFAGPPSSSSFATGNSFAAAASASSAMTTVANSLQAPGVVPPTYSMKRLWSSSSDNSAHSGIAYITHVRSEDDTKRLVSVTNDHLVRLYRGSSRSATASGASGGGGSSGGGTGGGGSSSGGGTGGGGSSGSGSGGGGGAGGGPGASGAGMVGGSSSGGGGGRGGEQLYTLYHSLPRLVESRGSSMRVAFWKGIASQHRPESPLYDDVEKDGEVFPKRVTECDLLIAGGGGRNSAVVYDVSEGGQGDSVIVDSLDGHRDRVTGAVVQHKSDNLVVATTSADSTIKIWFPVKS